jgi:protocatechuate 3,4-dioxygenase beta subunit
MTTRTTLTLLAAGLVLLLSALWLVSRPRRPASAAPVAAPAPARPAAPAQAAPATAALAQPAEPSDPAAPAGVAASSERVELASSPARADGPAPAPPTPAQAARVRGRCVDGAAQPLAGVEITGPGLAAAQSSGSDGTFALEIDLGGALRQTRDLEFARAGLGTRRLQVLLRAGELHELAEVVLLTAGRLAGRVADARGRPLEAASVKVEEALDLSSGSRFTGPSEALGASASAADGSFALEGVAPGRVRVWAGLEDWLWSTSEPLELAPGGEHTGLELVLEPLAPEDTIRLTVVDPAGAPVPRARVRYHYETEERSGSGDTQADEQGVFKKFLDVRATHSFHASDPDDRFRPAVARDVPPGTHDLVLQLGERRTFRLKAEEPGGKPVERFGVDLSLARGLGWGRKLSADDPDGVLEIVTPPETFELVVDAAGFEVEKLGPYEPGAMPDRVVARLRALPGVRGRVSSAAGPLAGATVSLHEAIAAGERYTVNGFHCWAERYSQAEARTDEDGEYVLTLRESGEWIVRAEAPGFAPGDAGPLRFEAGLGARGVDLRLGRGGGIAGRVLVVPGEEPSGHVVGFSRGDGHGFTARTDANGEYRLEGLTPGKWQVVWRQDEISTSSTTSSRSSGQDALAIPWDCEVHEGSTTRFDLDLRKLRLVVLAGRFRLGEAALRDWSVGLAALDDPTLEQESASLDPGGRFRLTTSATGRFLLSFSGQLGGSLVRASTELSLVPGDNAFEAEVPAGALRGRLAPGSFGGEARVRVHSAAHPGLSFTAILEHDAEGRFALEAFPAGSARLEYRTGAGAEGARDVEVPPRGTLEVRLP